MTPEKIEKFLNSIDLMPLLLNVTEKIYERHFTELEGLYELKIDQKTIQ